MSSNGTDIVYRERARLVAFVAAVYKGVIAYTDPAYPEWALVYVNTPRGQLSWHIAPEDLDLFNDFPVVRNDDPRVVWDKHGNSEKYARIEALVQDLLGCKTNVQSSIV